MTGSAQEEVTVYGVRNFGGIYTGLDLRIEYWLDEQEAYYEDSALEIDLKDMREALCDANVEAERGACDGDAANAQVGNFIACNTLPIEGTATLTVAGKKVQFAVSAGLSAQNLIENCFTVATAAYTADLAFCNEQYLNDGIKCLYQ